MGTGNRLPSFLYPKRGEMHDEEYESYEMTLALVVGITEMAFAAGHPGNRGDLAPNTDRNPTCYHRVGWSTSPD